MGVPMNQPEVASQMLNQFISNSLGETPAAESNFLQQNQETADAEQMYV